MVFARPNRKGPHEDRVSRPGASPHRRSRRPSGHQIRWNCDHGGPVLENRWPSPNTNENRPTSRRAEGLRVQTAMPVIAAAKITPAPATGIARFRSGFGAVRCSASTAPSGFAISASISIRTSPIACQRWRGSFSRHRATILRTPAGKRSSAGCSFTTETRMSVTVSPRENLLPGQHLVKYYAEGPDVGASVDRLAARLLGTHISRRAQDHARLRHRQRKRRRHGGARTWRDCAELARGLGEAEIENLDHAGGREFDVGRLQIAMDDAILVGRFQAFGDLPRDGDGFFERQRAARSAPSTSSITSAPCSIP